jgi:hypothetical protein
MVGERWVDGVLLPGRFRALLASLTAQGLIVTHESASAASFGDFQVLLSDGTLDVELLRDRGQPFVSIGLTNQRRLPIGVWRALVDGSAHADLATTFEEEAAFAEESLARVRARIAEGPVAPTLDALFRSATAVHSGLRDVLYD